jgi:small ligand-binding sensory domain FIST
VDDRRTTSAAADREALEQAGAEVGAAESEQLASGVDRLTILVGERARSQDVVRVADERDTQGSRHHRRDRGRIQVGNAWHR